MNTNLPTHPVASRAVLGAALVFALTASLVVPVQAQTLYVSESVSLTTQPNQYNPVTHTDSGTPGFTDFNPVLGSFNFSGDTALLAAIANGGGLQVVGVQLPLYGFDTFAGNNPLNPAAGAGQDYNNIALVLSGTVTAGSSLLGGANGSVETLNTGILLNGYRDTYTVGNFNYATGIAGVTSSLLSGYTAGSPLPVDVNGNPTSSYGFTPTGTDAGTSILDLLNDTGGLITASLLEINPENDLNSGSGENNFYFAGGTMSLAFSVPFTPMQWLGMGLIVLMAGVRLYSTGGLKQLRVLAGV
jgi:hypothetical protein